jgi:hypothetical protein
MIHVERRSSAAIDADPNVIPPPERKMDQPDRRDIIVDDTHALMSKSAFDKLPEYSATMPTGVYVGKMWKRHDGVYDSAFRASGGVPDWKLVWYGPVVDKKCAVLFRSIIIV